MIKKFFILVVIIFGAFQLAGYLRSSGEFIRFLDNNNDTAWAPKLEYYIGEFHTVFSNWDSAMFRFRRIVEKYPKTKYAPMAQFALAKAYDEKGTKAVALREYRKLVELYPDSRDSEMARERIEYLK